MLHALTRYRSAGPSDPYFSDVISLLHFDGTNTSTTITDQIAGNSWTTQPGANLDTSIKLFGTASLYVGGGGVTDTNPTIFGLNTGDFTIEWAQYWDNLTSYQSALSYGYISANALLLQTGSGTGKYIVYLNGSAIFTETSATPSLSTWYQYALVRSSGAVTLYRNGVAAGSATGSGSVSPSSVPFNWGGDNIYGYPPAGSHFDECRITRGIARYTSNYTPAVAAFPNH